MTDELVWRPMRDTDVAAWQTLLVAVESADHTGENFEVDDLAEELADPTLDLARDTMVAFDGPDMVAYAAILLRPPAEVDRITPDGAVHPRLRGRGIGGRLLDWQLRRAAEAHAERQPQVPGELHIQIHEANQGKRDLYAAHGFTVARWFFEMTCDLGGGTGVGSVPDGLALVPFAPEYDARVLAAHRDAFRDHWASTLPDEATWQSRFTSSRGFRPVLSFLMLDGAEVVGYALGYESDADTAAKGFRAAWVGQLGTRRAWRGRGVASALLRQFLATARDDGYKQAVLVVDGASPTGAVGLYERHGFVRAETWIRYVRPV